MTRKELIDVIRAQLRSTGNANFHVDISPETWDIIKKENAHFLMLLGIKLNISASLGDKDYEIVEYPF